MDKFAGYGYDVWTMDFEGYGKSSAGDGQLQHRRWRGGLEGRRRGHRKETGQQRYHFFGESSGGLRAGAYAMAHPERVGRLVLAAFTYTGEGSPTLADRAKQLDFYRTHNRRPRDRDMIRSIFTRDKAGTSDPAVGEALADTELPFGDTVPTGTYLDMTANLPVVDPLKVKAPVLLVRGEYDGIATEQDLLNFFRQLPNGDRQFVILAGHGPLLVLGLNREEFAHVMRAFLAMPPRIDSLKNLSRYRLAAAPCKRAAGGPPAETRQRGQHEWFSDTRRTRKLKPAERLSFASPIPTQIVSSDEYFPAPQNEKQREVEAR